MDAERTMANNMNINRIFPRFSEVWRSNISEQYRTLLVPLRSSSAYCRGTQYSGDTSGQLRTTGTAILSLAIRAFRGKVAAREANQATERIHFVSPNRVSDTADNFELEARERVNVPAPRTPADKMQETPSEKRDFFHSSSGTQDKRTTCNVKHTRLGAPCLQGARRKGAKSAKKNVLGCLAWHLCALAPWREIKKCPAQPHRPAVTFAKRRDITNMPVIFEDVSPSATFIKSTPCRQSRPCQLGEAESRRLPVDLCHASGEESVLHRR
jgi:hypothetical protein